MYSNSFIDSLKNKITLSDVIGKTVKIVIHGRNKVACCPFHKEKTPSFHINDEKGYYHCFGCGAHGDVISFTMQQDNLNFIEAVKKLAEENGIELPKLEKLTPEKQKEINEIDILYKINEETCNYYQSIIFSSAGKQGLEYLFKRGLTESNIKKFRIGFALNEFDALLNYLKKFGFSDKDIIKAGVVSLNEKKIYDKFRNRIMFPILDKSGKIIAFSGRVINSSDMPKYMNSPETPLYHKSDVLFNYFFAKKSIYDKRAVILVEGNIDTITLSVNGIENVVAPMGTAATERQIRELWKITDNIIVCFDGDSAGQKASKRLANLVLPIITASKSIKFVKLPKNQDPDDFIKEYGPIEFENLVKSSDSTINLSEFLWEYELLDQNINVTKSCITPEEKNKLEFNLNLLLKQIKDPIVSKNFQNFYRSKLFFIDRNDYKNNKMVSLYKSTTKIDYGKKVSSINSLENLKERIINIEKKMINIVYNNILIVDEFFKKYEVNLLSIDFMDKNITKIFNIFYEKINEKESILKELEKSNLNSYITKNNLFNINYSLNDSLNHLYSLFLERSILLSEIELKELAQTNNNEQKRKAIYENLELLHKKVNDFENNVL